jgi:hypothetical protein
MGQLSTRGLAATNTIEDELTKLRTAAAVIQKIRLSAQRELALAKQTRAEAIKYQQETGTKARSQAQQLILHARLETQKEIEELISKASAEIQKLLADIRVIRITAQEELAAQRKFNDAARICSLSLTVQKETGEPEEQEETQVVCKERKGKKQLACKK